MYFIVISLPVQAFVLHGTARMFDIAYLPQLNTRVGGVHLELFDTWDQLVVQEISRRTNVSGSNSQPDMDDSENVIDTLMEHDDIGLHHHQHQHPDSLDLDDLGVDDIDSLSSSAGHGHDAHGCSGRSVRSMSGISNSSSMMETSEGSHVSPSDNAFQMVLHWPNSVASQDSHDRFQDAQEFTVQFERPSKPVGTPTQLLQRLQALTAVGQTDMMKSMTQAQLVSVASLSCARLVQVEQRNQTLVSRLKVKNQTIRRLRQKVEAEKQLATVPADPLQVEKKNTKLTFRGSVALGCRKAMAVVSAQSFPLAGLVDVSRWTVTRSEILIWAVCVARVKLWHKIVYMRLAEVRSVQDDIATGERLAAENAVHSVDQSVVQRPTCQGAPSTFRVPSQMELICKDVQLPGENHAKTNSWHVGSTYFSGDATNSSFWQRQKLQGLETESSILVDIDCLSNLNYKDAFKTIWSMCLSRVLVSYICHSSTSTSHRY